MKLSCSRRRRRPELLVFEQFNALRGVGEESADAASAATEQPAIERYNSLSTNEPSSDSDSDVIICPTQRRPPGSRPRMFEWRSDSASIHDSPQVIPQSAASLARSSPRAEDPRLATPLRRTHSTVSPRIVVLQSRMPEQSQSFVLDKRLSILHIARHPRASMQTSFLQRGDGFEQHELRIRRTLPRSGTGPANKKRVRLPWLPALQMESLSISPSRLGRDRDYRFVEVDHPMDEEAVTGHEVIDLCDQDASPRYDEYGLLGSPGSCYSCPSTTAYFADLSEFETAKKRSRIGMVEPAIDVPVD